MQFLFFPRHISTGLNEGIFFNQTIANSCYKFKSDICISHKQLVLVNGSCFYKSHFFNRFTVLRFIIEPLSLFCGRLLAARYFSFVVMLSFYQAVSPSSLKNFPVAPSLSSVAYFTITPAPCSTGFSPL